MKKRKRIPLVEIAAALVGEKFGIPYEHRVLMTAHDVMSLATIDHDPIPHAQGGADKHYNLTILPIMAHRKKTAEQDVPQIAKTKRIAKTDALHKAKLALKAGQITEADAALAAIADPKRRRSKIPSRPFPKGHRPMRSRNSFERRPA